MTTPPRFQICSAEKLARLAKEGDIQVLDNLTRCYGEQLFAIGLRHCRNKEEAEDAVQDALVSAGTNLSTWRGDGALEAWVGRMVSNACHKIARGQKNNANLHTTEAEIPSENNPELEARRAELATTLGEALLGLSPQDRVIILLAETEDWTGPQIAEKLGLSPAAIRQRLSRARNQMRTQMEKKDVQV